jgi:hypothetical protein
MPTVSRWVAIVLFSTSATIFAQSRGTTPKRPTTPTPAARTAAKPPEPKTEPAMVACPQPLGLGVQTKRTFCDVLAGRDPAAGIIVTLPPHSGPVTLTFDLHNRILYSEDMVKAGRAYRRYTASIGVLAMDNTLLSRGLIQNEFRTAADLMDRISGGSGPGGVKAVAPSGTEPITVVVDPEEEKVSILGEKLLELRPDGRDEWTTSGRPIAIISNVMVQYQPPAPARRAAPTRRR